jgi:hypothetical protein
MEKKRSVGVAIFAWIFIVGGAFGIFGSLINMFSPINREFVDSFTLWQGIICSVLNLIVGIGLFNLKPWARKLTIALCALYIALVPLSYQRSIKMFEKISAMQDKILLHQMGQENRERDAQALKEIRQTMDSVTSISIKVGIAVGLIWNLGVIFYFTRPKVKEQFDSEQKSKSAA